MKKVACLIIILFLCGCGSPEKEPEMQKVKVEFRLAEAEPAEGLTEMTLSTSGQRFYLHDEVAMSNYDIHIALPLVWEGKSVVELTFTEAGKVRFAMLTEENVGKRIGILVDGELVSAPIVRAPISEGKAIIDGDFSEEEAHEIAAGIMRR